MSLTLDLLGVFFFALSGSLLAARRGFDIIGSVLLGCLTGLGGGVVRDLVLGLTPTAFDRPVYLVPPLVAAGIVYVLHGHMRRFTRPLLVCDAAGLGVFCTTGAVKALEHGMNPVAAILLGVTTGVGGGLLRDVVANRDPQLFDPRDIYALPAMLGAALVTAIWIAGWYAEWIAYVVAALVFALRILALWFRWRVPHAVRRPLPDAG
ncbi:trimeric intracellular cation channel family protein [Microbacterium karelineae]|uniref:trimeric intracellular cation channel family protein n=1 Tax=Microbacterium karelineae TaxID=2654283 RepID=UPI0012EAED15|nr:TRIC cation channel family protein [Microbacterium karelineae]